MALTIIYDRMQNREEHAVQMVLLEQERNGRRHDLPMIPAVDSAMVQKYCCYGEGHNYWGVESRFDNFCSEHAQKRQEDYGW